MAPHDPKPRIIGGDAPTKPTPTTTQLPSLPQTTCIFCGQDFPTRSSMFRHLERPSESCPAPRDDHGEKILLIVGYDSCLMRAGAAATTQPQPGQQQAVAPPMTTTSGGGGAVGGETAATFVVKAMGIEMGKSGDGDGDNSRPGGFSQASSVGSRTCPLLAQEAEASATADTICIKAPTTVPMGGVRAWLDKANAALDSAFNGRRAVRLLGRMVVPPTFHAEIHAKRRRYEYVIPAWMLDETAQVPWPEPKGQESMIPFLRRLRGKGMRPFGHCSGDHDGVRRRCPLWHNFSASALPHSPSSLRRLYRFYAMEVFRSPRGGAKENAGGGGGAEYVCLSISGDAFMSQQVRGMVALAIAGARGLVSAEDIATCIDPTRQEDLLPVPLAPALPCSLAEVGYSGWQTRLGVDGGGVCMSPGAEQRACLPLEGWSDEISRREGAEFRRGVLDSAACWWENQKGGAGWLQDVLVPGALKLRRELDASNGRTGAAAAEGSGGNGAALGEGGRDEGNMCSPRGEPSRNSSCTDGTTLSVEELSSLQEAPAAYAKVLRLLREADASGCWPYSTVSRSLVIAGNREERGDVEGGSEAVRNRRAMEGEEGNDADDAAAVAAVAAMNIRAVDDVEQNLAAKDDGQKEPPPVQQQQRGSGSFTLGAFPPPCPPPRGNRLFPALARAAFELEAALLPDRPASTTIAVNRNARFKPHVDSGAGAGQSRSLIVGLGDYKCGELVVEGEEVDIRYRPLEFNGWTQRHWTRPFFGERYSLVWFTPKGCEGITGDARFLTTPTAGAAGADAVDGTGGGRGD